MMQSNQRGITLISLMIGLVISMIAVLGMTSLFKTVIKNSVNASKDARITSERAAAFLIADMYLHDAGFGIDTEGDLDTNLLLLKSAVLPSSGKGKLSAGKDPDDNTIVPVPVNIASPGAYKENTTIIWRFKQALPSPPDYSPEPEPEPHCAGLHTTATGIYYLNPVKCTDVQSSLARTWETQKLVHDLAFEITLERKDSGLCSGFGVAGTSYLSVKLETKHSLGEGDDADKISLSSSTCLLNFSKP